MIFTAANPLMPAAFDVVWLLVLVVYAAVVAGAAVSLWRTRHGISPTALTLWTAAVVILPLLGGLAWLLLGRQARRRDLAAT